MLTASTQKYVELLEQVLGRADLAGIDNASLDESAVYAAVLRDGWSSAAADSIAGFSDGEVADSLGHRRLIYRPVKLYSIAQGLRMGGAQAAMPFRDSMTAAVNTLTGELQNRHVEWTAACGQSVARAAWMALATAALADVFKLQTESSAIALFDRMVAAQQPGGAWLATTSSDNIETHGYDELVLLHAIASYRVLSGRRDLDSAIAANAALHSRELQPDHATNQPWALHALAGTEATLPLAESLLHAAIAQQPAGLRGLPVVLLADALYGLRSIESVTD